MDDQGERRGRTWNVAERSRVSVAVRPRGEREVVVTQSVCKFSSVRGARMGGCGTHSLILAPCDQASIRFAGMCRSVPTVMDRTDFASLLAREEGAARGCTRR